MKVNFSKKGNYLLKGQSLFEVVMAVGLITLVMVSVVALATLSIRNVTFSKNQTLATQYSQEALEWIRGERDANWDDFYTIALGEDNSSFGKYCISNLTFTTTGTCSGESMIPGTLFIREVVFTVDPAKENEVGTKVSVYWADGAGFHEVVSDTVFTDWRVGN